MLDVSSFLNLSSRKPLPFTCHARRANRKGSRSHCNARRSDGLTVPDGTPSCSGSGSGAERLLRWAGLTATAAAASAAVALGTLTPQPAAAITNEQLVYLEAWRAVDRAYVDKTFNGKPWFKVREQALKQEPMNDREETYAAIRKTLALLEDPFTRFLEPQQYAALGRGIGGAVTGVGLEVGSGPDGKGLVVITPSAGGPAEQAGIRPQDRIVAIDGRPADDIGLYEAGSLLQGAADSQVTVTVQPSTGGGRKDVSLTRRPIKFNPVTSQLCGGGSGSTAYIRVATFSKQTADAAREAIKSLQSQGAARYVLDIRNNGGGSFPAGVDVARMWLNDGDIVLIADSGGIRDAYEADGTALEPTAPLSVLVNRGTASASEVLAGALKDNKRAVVVGEPTYGKGLIQTVVELSDGSAVAVTVSKYQTPAGVDINKKGIQPDILLPDDALPPPGTPGDFCKVLQAEEAPKLFR